MTNRRSEGLSATYGELRTLANSRAPRSPKATPNGGRTGAEIPLGQGVLGVAYLSQRGINKLRADIRAERKARVELLLMWVPGVVGVLGALIGLVAVLTARK